MPDGTVQKTGAIRIMINMMQKLLKDYPSAYAACVFDAKGPTFRDEIYPAYKEQRSPMPDDLRSQIAPIHEVVRFMGWPVLDVPGVEADDVIGTLAVAAAQQGMEVIVSSGDKDLAQLVNEHITIIDTMSGKRRDLAGVQAEFGVPASLMVDYQILVGDTVDNVPGVHKVGPKTAVKWLHRIRLAAGHRGQRRQHQGRRGREPAPGAGLVAHGPPVAHHQDRLRPQWLGARHAFAGGHPHGRAPGRIACGLSTRPTVSRAWPRALGGAQRLPRRRPKPRSRQGCTTGRPRPVRRGRSEAEPGRTRQRPKATTPS